MSGTVIFHYGGYRVTSYDNGGAYKLEALGTEAFVQHGDDATQFRDDFDGADRIEDAERSIRTKCSLIADYMLS